MSLSYNGTELQSITWNGADVQSVTMDGVEVWSAVDPVLNNNSWDVISKIAKSGKGSTYWNIGDRKEIILNGTIGTLTLSNVHLWVYILDFNHPINKTTADNNIIFGGFMTALNGGTSVALVDSKYGKYGGGAIKSFTMNHNTANYGGYTYGGWKATDFRYDILGATQSAPTGYMQTPGPGRTGYDATEAAITSPVANTLMSALPTDFRNVLRLWTRYTNNTGNESNNDSDITVCIDAISLLTEFEIFGVRTYANQYEQNHQKQMAYYSNGNSKVKYRHDDFNTSCKWFTSSMKLDDVYDKVLVQENGNVNFTYASAHWSWGLAPAFKV